MRIVATVWAALALSAPASVADPPRLDFAYHKVGDIAVGMYRGSIDYRYPNSQVKVTTENGAVVIVRYSVHGGAIEVTYEHGRAASIVVDSSYYRTRAGFGVGSRVPLGPCHKTKANPCQHRWHGFTLGSAGVWWNSNGYFYTRGGSVTRIVLVKHYVNHN